MNALKIAAIALLILIAHTMAYNDEMSAMCANQHSQECAGWKQ